MHDYFYVCTYITIINDDVISTVITCIVLCLSIVFPQTKQKHVYSQQKRLGRKPRVYLTSKEGAKMRRSGVMWVMLKT